jgi:hypothetical protein
VDSAVIVGFFVVCGLVSLGGLLATMFFGLDWEEQPNENRTTNMTNRIQYPASIHSDPTVELELETINAQLRIAFGSSESRTIIVDPRLWTDELGIDVEYTDE